MITKEWTTDVKRRIFELEKLAGLSGGKLDADGFYWGNGRYHVLHFDLITIDKQDEPRHRDVTYQAIHAVVEKHKGFRLGGSVYAIPIPAGTDAKPSAMTFWNAVQAATAGELIEGDLIVLHYSASTKNDTASIAQVVLGKATSFSPVTLKT